MAWTVEEWKECARARLQGIGAWLGRRAPYAAYGALCGLSSWPLVEGNVHGDVVTGSRHTLFDQRGQRVRRQINVAGDWKGDEPPADD